MVSGIGSKAIFASMTKSTAARGLNKIGDPKKTVSVSAYDLLKMNAPSTQLSSIKRSEAELLAKLDGDGSATPPSTSKVKLRSSPRI